jgi:DNA-binding transcriptional LysR family regulator
VRSVVCGRPAYFSSHGLPATPQQLSEHDCIRFDVLASRRAGVSGEAKQTVSVTVISRLLVNTAEAAIDAAILGVGLVGVLSYQVAAALAQGKLAKVLEDFEPPPARQPGLQGPGAADAQDAGFYRLCCAAPA